MKKNLIALLVAITPFMISCKKEVLNENGMAATTQNAGNPTTGRENCEPFQFGILGLSTGTVMINGIDYLTGDVGYSPLVVSTTNKNVRYFDGSTLVHTQVANFLFTSASFIPSYGIESDAMGDVKITQANQNAATLSPRYASFAPNITLGNVTTNKTITGAGLNTIVNMTSLNLSNETLTLVGTAGTDDGFIINVTGSFNLSQSSINLVNVRPERILFNFPNASQVVVDRSVFNGTILARTGNVICFEPQSFDGSIIAKNVTLFSMGSILANGNGNGNSQNKNSGNGGIDVSSCTWVTNFTQRTYCNGNQW